MELILIICVLICNEHFVLSANPEQASPTSGQALKEGSPCNIKSGKVGKCVSSLNCLLLDQEKRKNICEWRGSTAIVCCPQEQQVADFVPLAFHKVLKEGAECSITSGEKGECTPSLRCKLPLEKKLTKLCEFNGLTPVVCCPKDKQIEGRFRLPDCSANPTLCTKLSFCQDSFFYQQGGYVYNCQYDIYSYELCCINSTFELHRSPPSIQIFQEEGSACDVNHNVSGTCELVINCNLNSTKGIVNICGWARDMPLVCCSELIVDPKSYEKDEDKYSVRKSSDLPACMAKDNQSSCKYVRYCPFPQLYHYGERSYRCTERNERKICCIDKKNDLNNPITTLPSRKDEGSTCEYTSNETGSCEYVSKCNLYHSDEVLNICGWKGSSFAAEDDLIACCPDCGVYLESSWTRGELYGRVKPFVGVYILNRTADILLSLNYSLHVTQMLADQIEELQAHKGNRRFLLKKHSWMNIVPIFGGVPAARKRAVYMASLGAKVPRGIEWLCDGVVISSQWIMSAAHCFVGSGMRPDIIRLGVYEKEESFYEPYPDYDGIEDFDILEVKFYPDFVNPQRYHDLVLIKLSRSIPKRNTQIKRICLPTLPEHKVAEGQVLTLTGWGATKYLGEKINVLHEVNLTVFHTALCDASYSTLSDYDTKWAEGMDPDRILCVGTEGGGKDACKGDSGGPLVFTDNRQRVVLAGIVSGGYGCGNPEFPGIYIPIAVPEYLEWIKKTAF